MVHVRFLENAHCYLQSGAFRTLHSTDYSEAPQPMGCKVRTERCPVHTRLVSR